MLGACGKGSEAGPARMNQKKERSTYTLFSMFVGRARTTASESRTRRARNFIVDVKGKRGDDCGK